MRHFISGLLRSVRLPSPAFADQPPAEAHRRHQLEQQIDLLRRECRLAERRERERIACLLHDDIGQMIALMRIRLGRVRMSRLETPDSELDELGQLVEQAAQTTRALTHELGASLVAQPLRPALHGIAQEMSRRSGLAVALRMPQEELCLPEPQRSVVYRTVREFCFNAQKHAQATKVSIESRISVGRLWVDVLDNGKGMNVPAPAVWRPRADGGFGLASAQTQLRALGGDLHVRPLPGRGTRASLMIPLDVV